MAPCGAFVKHLNRKVRRPRAAGKRSRKRPCHSASMVLRPGGLPSVGPPAQRAGHEAAGHRRNDPVFELDQDVGVPGDGVLAAVFALPVAELAQVPVRAPARSVCKTFGVGFRTHRAAFTASRHIPQLWQPDSGRLTPFRPIWLPGRTRCRSDAREIVSQNWSPAHAAVPIRRAATHSREGWPRGPRPASHPSRK